MKNKDYEPAIKKLREMAKEIEDMFDGVNEFRMSEACQMSTKIERLKYVADILERES